MCVYIHASHCSRHHPQTIQPNCLAYQLLVCRCIPSMQTESQRETESETEKIIYGNIYFVAFQIVSQFDNADNIVVLFRSCFAVELTQK